MRRDVYSLRGWFIFWLIMLLLLLFALISTAEAQGHREHIHLDGSYALQVYIPNPVFGSAGLRVRYLTGTTNTSKDLFYYYNFKTNNWIRDVPGNHQVLLPGRTYQGHYFLTIVNSHNIRSGTYKVDARIESEGILNFEKSWLIEVEE